VEFAVGDDAMASSCNSTRVSGISACASIRCQVGEDKSLSLEQASTVRS